MNDANQTPENALPEEHSPADAGPSFDRRKLLVWSGLASVGAIGAATFFRKRTRHYTPTPMFIAKNQRYDGPLAQTIRDGLAASGIQLEQLRGKKVLLKPNLVEPNRAVPHMTTHLNVVLAAMEVFRSVGAEVAIGEGPGHMRDTEQCLAEGGYRDAIRSERLTFADLNYEDTGFVDNGGHLSKLEGFHFPKSVVEADLIVSMPKMKTHHWVGVTASMKNLYGVIPGIRYGWPKNVLHHNGIPETVFDINASLPKTIAIVDGIDCMEGDGPIMGTLKKMGLILIGATPASVDATVCRLMDLDPNQVSYLRLASENGLGSLRESEIRQEGEPWRPLMQTFAILDKPHLTRLRERSAIPSS